MPVNHDAAPTITGMPFGHQVAVPRSNLVESAAQVVPGAPQTSGLRIASVALATVRMLLSEKLGRYNAVEYAKLVITDIRRAGGNVLSSIGSQAVKAEQQALISHNGWQSLPAGRGQSYSETLCQGGFLENIQSPVIGQARATSDFSVARPAGSGTGASGVRKFGFPRPPQAHTSLSGKVAFNR